jgi:small GTP-binding protein
MGRFGGWWLAAAALLALVVVAVVVQALNSLIWNLQLLLPAWLVGPLLLLLLGGGALLMARLLWPWLRGRSGGRGSRRPDRPGPPPGPRDRTQAASQHLEAVDRVLERVRDAVQAESLRQEAARVARDLERGDLEVVVFGSGSSGKTSLIRALLQEMVGRVGAAMGSTDRCQRYRLELRGLRRGLILIDTPGILEAGAAGRSREQEARQRAARADLVLLVVDGDLRRSEMEVLRGLADLGKRLLLVLNKCDLRGEAEERRLLVRLAERCRGLVDPADLVPVSAAPRTIPRPGGRPLQPAPELEALLRRMAELLHRDGEELIADNILLQCRHLGEASRRLLERQRQQDAEAVVDRHAWICGGVLAVTPLPGVDLLAGLGVQAQMVMEIARVYGVELSRDRAGDLALTLGRALAALGVLKGGMAAVGAALTLNVPALLLSRALQAVAGAWLTRVAGLSLITYFRQDQTWGDGGVQEVVQRQYDLSRRGQALQQFLDAAFRRVVEPLRRGELQLPPQGRRPHVPPEPPEAGGGGVPSRRER